MVRNAGLDIPGNDVGTLELDKDTPGGPLRPRNIRAIVGSRRGTRVTPGSGMLTEATKYIGTPTLSLGSAPCRATDHEGNPRFCIAFYKEHPTLGQLC